MNKPVLVIMAAGMGSRYGGLKQIDPIGPSGESLMDYSLYDAKEAGFEQVVFIIKKEIEKDFKETIGNRVSEYFHVDYVFQDVNSVPDGFLVPKERTKPWGTGHAVLAAKDVISEPFAVINADDCYGRQAFSKIYDFLKNVKDSDVFEYAMVGYRLGNTLTENGFVSRGVCESEKGYLKGIEERTQIERKEKSPAYTEDGGRTWVSIAEDTVVSMNLWGFTPGFFQELEKGFSDFLETALVENPLKGEFYLPFAVNDLLKEKKARVQVLQSEDKWYGMTYKEDKASVQQAILNMVKEKKYPKKLWDFSPEKSGKDYANPISLDEAEISGRFWKDFMEKARTQVIPYQWEALNDRIPDAEPSYAMQNFRIAAGREKGEFKGYVFQDSDLAKWLEAAAYSLMWNPDPELEKTMDGAIEDVVAAQQPDGYLNTYYIINGLEKRFTNLRDHHELYCLGHFLEAGVAYYRATGKDKLLNALIRYVDLVDSLIGPEEGKLHGYPGHEEIELALVKLYDITKEERHLRLSQYFLEQRGQDPNYFQEEKKKSGTPFAWEKSWFQYDYYQAGVPLSEQHSAVGHAVRAVYLYTGMADVARRTGNKDLEEICFRLWENMTKRRMYVTGSIGSSSYGEAFTFDYDLPNDTIYGETCAAIGLIFFAQRMLNANRRGEYADILEKCLYNGVISGMSSDGTSFFYVNPLEVLPEASEKDQLRRHVKVQRQKWFGCACCPPNLARLLTSLASFMYSKTKDSLFVHLYAEGKIQAKLEDGAVDLQVKTNYPWNGDIEIDVEKVPLSFTLALRIPAWCANWTLSLDGKLLNVTPVDGYVYLKDILTAGAKLQLQLDMQVSVLEANPRVRENVGKVCVQRGPMIYCLEETDNGKDLHRVYFDEKSAFVTSFDEKFFGGAVLLESEGKKLREGKWAEEALYQPTRRKEYEDKKLKWIPYYLWANREPGEMTVWIKNA